MTYAQFLLNTIIDNQLTSTHHIIPRSVGGSDDKTNIMKLTPAQHAYAHYLFDKEHGTNTFKFFANRLGITDLDDVTYEDCLPFNSLEKKRTEIVSEAMKESWQDVEKTIHRRRRMAEAKIGKENCCAHTVWCNNGEIRKRVPVDEVPVGFTLGKKFH